MERFWLVEFNEFRRTSESSFQVPTLPSLPTPNRLLAGGSRRDDDDEAALQHDEPMISALGIVSKFQPFGMHLQIRSPPPNDRRLLFQWNQTAASGRTRATRLSRVRLRRNCNPLMSPVALR